MGRGSQVGFISLGHWGEKDVGCMEDVRRLQLSLVCGLFGSSSS